MLMENRIVFSVNGGIFSVRKLMQNRRVFNVRMLFEKTD